MANSLYDVTIVQSQNGLGRAVPGQDYISALVFYSDVLPSGFTTENNIVQVLSLAQAEALGITNTYSDETPAVGTVTITGIGSVGNSISIYVQEPVNNVLLATYVQQPGDTTTDILAASIAHAIAVNNTTGYTASVVGSVLSITARPGLGEFLNGATPALVFGVTSTITATTGAFADGVPSLLIQWWYHISEYFRLNPQGNLFVGFFPVFGNLWNLSEIQAMQIFANGIIRQVGLYLSGVTADESTSPASIVNLTDTILITLGGTVQQLVQKVANLVQSQCSYLASLHQPLIGLFAVDFVTLTSPDTLSALTTLLDNTQLQANRSYVTIGQDGAGQGAFIFATQESSITDIGATLGVVSLSGVAQDIANPQNFNMTDGVELATPAYANGRLFNTISDYSLELQLQNYSYLYLKNYQGLAGTYQQNNNACITEASDYAYMNDNRVWDKASRLLYAALIPLLASNLTLNPDGTLAATTLAYVTSVSTNCLTPMVRAIPQELSAFNVVIDPDQDVLSTNTLVVTVQLLPEGVARNIVVNLGYVTSIS